MKYRQNAQLRLVSSLVAMIFPMLPSVINAADTANASTNIQKKSQVFVPATGKKEVYIEPTRGSRASNAVIAPEIPEPMSNNEIRDLMIEESIRYHGHCVCPYSPDAIGGQCGTEAKYYKPGGFRLYCYRIDISSEEVYWYRLKRAYWFPPGGGERAVIIQQPNTDPTANYFRNNAPSLESKRRSDAVSNFINNPPSNQEDNSANYFKNNAEGYYNPQNNNFPANSSSSSTSNKPPGAINYQYNPSNPYGITNYPTSSFPTYP